MHSNAIQLVLQQCYRTNGCFLLPVLSYLKLPIERNLHFNSRPTVVKIIVQEIKYTPEF